MKKNVLLLLILVAFSFAGNAQITYPSPFNLSTGDYTFDNWPASSAAGTYPPHMRFYRISSTNESLKNDTIYQDYTAAYNIASGTRINGLGEDGVSFINTGNSVYKVGAAVVSLNTVNRNSIEVSWTGKTVTPNFRAYEIRFYYRVGDQGNWTPYVSGTSDTLRYVRSANAGDSLVLGPVTLPAVLENEPLVQLQWKYFQMDTNTASGARAELAISSILITSQGMPSPVIQSGSSSVAPFAARVSETSPTDTFTVSGTALTDPVELTAPSSFEIADNASGPFGPTLTLVPASGVLDPTVVYVRFVPSVPGPVSGSVTVGSTGAGSLSVHVSGYGAGYTNPPAFDASASTYLLNGWDSDTPAGVFPPNMRFHTTVSDEPLLSYASLVNDWHCAYDLGSRPRVKGLDTLGFSFINTGSAQYDNCSNGASALNTYLGGAVLALKTGNFTTTLRYNAGLQSQGDGATPRVYNLRLQYRLDTLSNFSDVSPLQEFSSENRTAGDLEHFTFTLPSNFLNREYIQFRWLYYAVPVPGASGTRPEIRIDEIEVKTNPVGVGEQEAQLRGLLVFPNPVKNGAQLRIERPVNGTLYDLSGRVALQLHNVAVISTASLATGVYTLRTDDGAYARIVIQ